MNGFEDIVQLLVAQNAAFDAGSYGAAYYVLMAAVGLAAETGDEVMLKRLEHRAADQAAELDRREPSHPLASAAARDRGETPAFANAERRARAAAARVAGRKGHPSRAESVTYSVDPSRSLVRLTYHETPAFADWVAAMEAVFRDPDYQPGFAFLTDRTGVEAPTTRFVRNALAFLEAHAAELAGARWAAVMVDPIARSMARMAQSLAAGLPVILKVFPDVASAEEWLERSR